MKFRLLVSALALSLAACGGGGGDAPAPTLQLSNLEGMWSGALSGADLHGATSADATVLDDGTAWIALLVGETPVGLIKTKVSVSGTTYSGTGTDYSFAPSSARAITVSGSANSETTASGKLSASLLINGASAATVTEMSAAKNQERYKTAAVQGDFAGSWKAPLSGVTVTWDVVANGTLTGTNTTGCTYAGTVLARPYVAIYNLNVTETCAGQANKQFEGIARLNSAKTGAVFEFVTADATVGSVLLATRN